MAIKAGVWIDHHKAVVVRLNNQAEEVRQVHADQDKLAPSAGVQHVKNSYTPNDYVAEDKLERKATAHLNKFFDEVIACLHDADAILVLGPGEAKGEFAKRIESHRPQAHLEHVETTGKLTDPQIAAYVRKHFHQ